MQSDKPLKSLSKNDLIQEINVLGPWIHGYFDLGNGLIIEDQDKLHKKRIFSNRDYFFEIISKFYSRDILKDKSICDVGCNTGFFLYEIYKKFKFNHALGLEPRKSNLIKAQFIADYFELPKTKYELRQFDILSKTTTFPISDVVIIPGVFHHLNNHLLALENLYSMTRELCIVETFVLPDSVNSDNISQHMSLGETLYQNNKNKNKFGIVGYKLETNRLDGATFQSGIVGVLTTNTLVMMMEHVGFEDVYIFRSEQDTQNQVYNKKSYREYHSVIVVGSKKNSKRNYSNYFEKAEDDLEEKKFSVFIPLKFIEPVYNVISGKSSIGDLETIPRLIYNSEMYYTDQIGVEAQKNLTSQIGGEPYFELIKTFKHSPKQKISFEYAKTCYYEGKINIAHEILEELINTVNLDWRVVFMSYYLLAKINFDLGNNSDSKRYIDLSLRTHPGYSLAKKLKQVLNA